MNQFNKLKHLSIAILFSLCLFTKLSAPSFESFYAEFMRSRYYISHTNAFDSSNIRPHNFENFYKEFMRSRCHNDSFEYANVQLNNFESFYKEFIRSLCHAGTSFELANVN